MNRRTGEQEKSFQKPAATIDHRCVDWVDKLSRLPRHFFHLSLFAAFSKTRISPALLLTLLDERLSAEEIVVSLATPSAATLRRDGFGAAIDSSASRTV